MGWYWRYLYFLTLRQSKNHYTFWTSIDFQLWIISSYAWLDWSWTSFIRYSKQMFKSLHSLDLHLNWGWLCSVCKSQSLLWPLYLWIFPIQIHLININFKSRHTGVKKISQSTMLYFERWQCIWKQIDERWMIWPSTSKPLNIKGAFEDALLNSWLIFLVYL